MRSAIIKNQEFNILSRKIDNASKCAVTEVYEDSFDVKVPDGSGFEQGESVELFSMTSKGQLYFETLIKEIQGDILTIWFPIYHKYLQRREFSRIKTEQYAELVSENTKVEAKICDISAGGLKIETKEQLKLLTDYKIKINLENKVVETKLELIRTEAQSERFISSGRFKDLNNYDRIMLVQYCFVKQIENKNR